MLKEFKEFAMRGNVVDLAELEPVHISNVTLKLVCADLLEDPESRHGLVNLWRAEAEEAGLQIAASEPADGRLDDREGYLLATITAAGEDYLLCAVPCPAEDNTILLQAIR